MVLVGEVVVGAVVEDKHGSKTIRLIVGGFSYRQIVATIFEEILVVPELLQRS